MFKFFTNFTRTLSNAAAKSGPIQQAIEQKIKTRFGKYELIHCEVRNLSWQHNVPKGSETHFEVIVVSNKFDSMKKIDRQRILNETLDEEIKKKGVSVTYALLEPTRWYNSIKRGLKLEEIHQVPPCLGGRARELVKEEKKTEEIKS